MIPTPQTSPREPISYDAVAQICQALADAGDKPSVRRVQAEAGGGSNTTILNHLRRWQDNQRAAASAGPADGLLTTELRAALATWVQGLATAAKADAERRANELDELYAAAQDGWQKAEARISALEAELAATTTRCDAQEHEHAAALAAAEARALAAGTQIAELQERVGVEQRNAETSRVTAAEARIKADAAAEGVRTLGDENKAMRAELKELHKSAAAAEQRAAVAEERAQNRDEQLAELRQTLEVLRQGAQEMQGRLVAADKARSDAERELAVCKSERAALERGRDTPKPETGGMRPGSSAAGANQGKETVDE